REPEYVIASYAAVRHNITLEDIGFVQQAELFEYVKNISGKIPLVIDSREFLMNPGDMLTAVCDRLHIEFDEAMLKWPKGPRPGDGVWAKYWYKSVWNSTGFTVYRHKPVKLDKENRAIAEQAQAYYDLLFEHRLQV
ncbi:MAG: HAD family hydrolase, partial [Gammaproteobacteria bacterium]|nr:HAD family hydrolase [Gammaproteobacteria bacterium]